jgi:4-amino-4-deoxychorismate lyase
VAGVTRVFLLEGLREVPADAPVLAADDLGVLRGESVFETLRVVEGRPCFLGDHLERMARSAARVALELPPGFDQLALTAAEGVSEASLRLVCSKGASSGPVGFAVVSDISAEVVAQRAGVTCVTLPLGITADFRSAEPWTLGGVKSTSYAVNMSALRHAHELGADDAIWTSTDGYVLEAPTATVIALVDGAWVTPPATVGILPGTTLLAVQRLEVPGLASIATHALTVAELAAAEEVALLSSVRGVAPVTALDGRPLTVEQGAALAKAYEASLPR